MKASAAAALGASVAGIASGDSKESNASGAPRVRGKLDRFSTTALGAEVTGPFVFDDGTLLYSLQHPSHDNPEPYDKGGIGYIRGFNFEMQGTNDDFSELSTPQTKDEQSRVRAAAGEFELLAQQEDPIQGGEEQLGVPETPDGIPIDKFAGTRYSDFGNDPDCNQFIPTNEEKTEGYLFTNFEQSPGEITRIPISQNDDGTLDADLDNALNLANTEALRSLGGTRINCYGDRTPWNTMVSSEENYAHPRVALTNSVSDIANAGSGEGLLGQQAFWNRPNPSGIQQAVNDEYDDIDGWYVHGYWAATGVELLAYYLGADPVDQEGLDKTTTESLESGGEAAGSNTRQPIGDTYPNPYRYGYHIDFREPAADEPQPIKYYVMGRAAWEAPDFQNDLRTVYGCSDGDSKGIYKFVADEEIPSYDDPMDIEGTLYAPKITTPEASDKNAPLDVPLDIEWVELGHASNREIESWIAEYDDVTQQDYLETHAETDWQEDLDAAIEEADKEVIENGNQNYVTDQEILDWAEQYEQNGPGGVDEDLRRVPFIETRAAAKEIGASIEFNKAEGVDSKEDAEPGDYVYFGISEFNDDMADSTGDLQMGRVDGGVVYRSELEDDYNVSRLEPVIIGPNGTDKAAIADNQLINVDNVLVMDDGRVLCCEDADQFGRSYPNDGLYVFEPNRTDKTAMLNKFDFNDDGQITSEELQRATEEGPRSPVRNTD
jgi:secreted PhoX family phosphatase